jgi:hypothetical protein
MEDRELLAAIGQVVVNAAALEYAIAVLVATIEGHRDQECEDHALTIVKNAGGAMRALMAPTCAQVRGRGMSPQQIARMLSTTQETAISEKDVRESLKRWDREHASAGPLTERNLIPLWRDAKAVLDDRHVIAHSIAMEQVEAGLVILDARRGRETTLTTPAVLSHVQDIRIAYRRFHNAIAAEISSAPGQIAPSE